MATTGTAAELQRLKELKAAVTEVFPALLAWACGVGAATGVDGESAVQGAVEALYTIGCPPGVQPGTFLRYQVRQRLSNACRKEVRHGELLREHHDYVAPAFPAAPDAELEAVEFNAFVASLFDTLYRLAGAKRPPDDDLQLLLTEMEDEALRPGPWSRRRLLECAGMEAAEYRKLHKRIAPLLAQLPGPLQRRAADILGRESHGI